MPVGPISAVAAAAKAASKKKKEKKEKEPSAHEKMMMRLRIKGALRKKGGGYSKSLTAAERARLGIKDKGKRKGRKTKDD